MAASKKRPSAKKAAGSGKTPPAERQLTCFVVIGFGRKTDYATGRMLDLDKTYEQLIRPAFDRVGVNAFRAIDANLTGSIDSIMYRWIYEADIVVAGIIGAAEAAKGRKDFPEAIRLFQKAIDTELESKQAKRQEGKPDVFLAQAGAQDRGRGQRVRDGQLHGAEEEAGRGDGRVPGEGASGRAGGAGRGAGPITIDANLADKPIKSIEVNCKIEYE